MSQAIPSFNSQASNKISISGKTGSTTPAGTWKRFVALIVDSLIVSMITIPLTMANALAIPMLAEVVPPEALGAVSIALSLLSFPITFFYYALFYQKKGATPGKMLFKMKVLNNDTGGNLTYFETFKREIIGRMLSTLLFMIGYLMAIFREDKRALHDLIGNSQVIQDNA